MISQTRAKVRILAARQTSAMAAMRMLVQQKLTAIRSECSALSK
ncbi:MAG: hypothetical protein ACD_75C02481G0004 [uncultured bacterium]|nr:MAG: hypothetical protein ACD_75C02481G0004 [uncultured bacterium]